MQSLGSVWNSYLEKKLWDDAYAQWLASESGQEMEGRVRRWCRDNLEGCCFDDTRISYGEMIDTHSGNRYDIVYLRQASPIPMTDVSLCAHFWKKWKNTTSLID